eukprot:6602509-Pyramimonas_sp.AAC.1
MAARGRRRRTHRSTARRGLSSSRSHPVSESKFSPALGRRGIASLLDRASPTNASLLSAP